MGTTFDLAAIWLRGDAVSHAVAVILLVMSVISWVVIIMGLLRHLAMKRQKAAARGFWSARDIESGITAITDRNSVWRLMAEEGREALTGYMESEKNPTICDKSDWVFQSLTARIDRKVKDLGRGLSALSSIGATAPFVGLLGTVWGIYHTLLSLSGGGAMTIDQVAGPIGEALVMTAFGLFVAIPAVLGNNAIIALNRHWGEELGLFAQQLDAYLLTGRKPLSLNYLEEDGR